MHPETSNITIGHCLRDPVSEVGWEPPDHDLIGVLVPEKIDPHAVAVLARVSPHGNLFFRPFPEGVDGRYPCIHQR